MAKNNDEKKKKNKKKSKKQKALEKKLEMLREINERRQLKHLEKCEKRLRCEKRCEEEKACMAPGLYFPPPKGQTNIWYSINQDLKHTLISQFTFQNLPIPKPPCPPIADLTLEDLDKLPEKELRCMFGGEVPDLFKRKSTDKKKSKKRKKKKNGAGGGDDDDEDWEEGENGDEDDESEEDEKPKVTRKNFQCPTCPPKKLCPGPIN